MASKAAQHKSELIERVKALAAARLPAERATALSAFVAQFYANVAIDDLASESPDNLYAAALSLWTFAGQRAAGTAKVRVYNPRLDEQGWHSSHTVVEVVNDDMPFLVDSLTSALNQRDLTVYLVIHPIVRVLRDRTGNRAVAGKGEEVAESQMQIRINEQTAPDRLAEIKYLLEQVLADVRAATSDWRSMRARAEEILAALDTAPAALPADEIPARGPLPAGDLFAVTLINPGTYRATNLASQAQLQITVAKPGRDEPYSPARPTLVRAGDQGFDPPAAHILAGQSIVLLAETPARFLVEPAPSGR